MFVVMCIFKQLYQTAANDHQCYMQVETESLTETKTAIYEGLKLSEEQPNSATHSGIKVQNFTFRVTLSSYWGG